MRRWSLPPSQRSRPAIAFCPAIRICPVRWGDPRRRADAAPRHRRSPTKRRRCACSWRRPSPRAGSSCRLHWFDNRAAGYRSIPDRLQTGESGRPRRVRSRSARVSASASRISASTTAMSRLVSWRTRRAQPASYWHNCRKRGRRRALRSAALYQRVASDIACATGDENLHHASFCRRRYSA